VHSLLDKTSEELLKYLKTQYKNGVHQFNSFENLFNEFINLPNLSAKHTSPIELTECLKKLKSDGYVNCNDSQYVIKSIEITYAGITYFELKQRSNIDKFIIPAAISIIINVIILLIKYIFRL
jgi:hypothetical protein